MPGSPGTPESRRALVWLRADQVDLALAAAAAAELRVIAAGSPVRGESVAVAERLGAEPRDDLRAAIAGASADLVLILAPGEFGSPEDAAALLAAAGRGVRVASLEPLPARALDLAGDAWRWRSAGVPSAVPAFVPRMRAGRAWRQAWEGAEAFGPARSANVVTLGRPSEGTLGARLTDAMDLLLSVFGEPESIDAAYAGGAAASGLHPLPGETLRGLHGDMSANLRFSGGRAASLLASDRAGRWERAAVVLTPGATLRCGDEGAAWAGAPEPGKPRRPRSPKPPAGDAPGRLLGAAVSAIFDAALFNPAEDPGVASVLAACQAALLSARTGQPESPATIRRMLGVE